MPNNAYKSSKSHVWTEDEMQKAIKAFREGSSQRHAAELYGVPHSCLQRRLQSGQDKPLKHKRGQEEEENDSTCGFCSIKYMDPRSKKLGDWIQCQGNGKEWYHEHCVGPKGKKKFVCGKCGLFD